MTIEVETAQDLITRPETVQRMYAMYTAQRLFVNRRYQRKLVWSVEEKRSFIDTIRRGYPVPLFLMAETQQSGQSPKLEIIDGMQRLNAIMDFLEGQFDIDGRFFNPTTIPETSAIPKEPERLFLPHVECSAIVAYQLPLSIYRNTTEDQVDDIFRRFNSGGRRLSRQELRQAGSTGLFATTVRRIAATVRGDVSHGDTLSLHSMKEISITSQKLPYGIRAEETFWVKHRVLTREFLRESRDEEIIADILGYVLVNPRPPSGSDVIDHYYGMYRDDEASAKDRAEAAETALRKNGPDPIVESFIIVFDAIRQVLDGAENPVSFSQLISKTRSNARVPRYFQLLFLSFHRLLIEENRSLARPDLVHRKLDGIAASLKISEGGSWAAQAREKLVDSLSGTIKGGFSGRDMANNESPIMNLTIVDALLTQSRTENGPYDFKTGTLLLSDKPTRDPAIFNTIGETTAAISNAGPGSRGYILVGIADKASTADRIRIICGVIPVIAGAFFVTGLDHEPQALGFRDIDKYFQSFIQSLKSLPLTPAVMMQVERDIRLVTYHGRTIIVISIKGSSEPCSFQDKYFVRSGPNNEEVKGEGLKTLFRRFAASGQL